MKNFHFVIALVLLSIVVACQPVMISAPAVSVDVAEPAQPSGPPTPFPVANLEEEEWKQDALRALVLNLVIPEPMPDLDPIEAAGTYITAGPPSDWVRRDMNGRCIVDITLPLEFSGTLSGIAITKYQILVENECIQNTGPGQSDEVWQATGTFEGTVEGIEGSFDFIYVVKVSGGGDGMGQFDGKLGVYNGTQGLSSLRGVLTFDDQLVGANAGPSAYSGMLYLE